MQEQRPRDAKARKRQAASRDDDGSQADEEEVDNSADEDYREDDKESGGGKRAAWKKLFAEDDGSELKEVEGASSGRKPKLDKGKGTEKTRTKHKTRTRSDESQEEFAGENFDGDEGGNESGCEGSDARSSGGRLMSKKTNGRKKRGTKRKRRPASYGWGDAGSDYAHLDRHFQPRGGFSDRDSERDMSYAEILYLGRQENSLIDDNANDVSGFIPKWVHDVRMNGEIFIFFACANGG